MGACLQLPQLHAHARASNARAHTCWPTRVPAVHMHVKVACAVHMWDVDDVIAEISNIRRLSSKMPNFKQ